MPSIIPLFPRVVFVILEPISLVAGFVNAFLDTPGFLAKQYPSSTPFEVFPMTPDAQIVTLQLGNVYLLLALLGVFILTTTTDPRVVKLYIIALAIADVGHMGASMWVLGWNRVINIRGWNSMAWGNIGASVFLLVTRIGYLLGFFGMARATGREKGS